MDEVALENRLTRLEETQQYIGEEMADIEENQQDIKNLIISVNVLATEVKHLVEDVCKMASRLDRVEAVPAARWNDLVKTIITVGASGVAGYFISKFLI